MYTCNGLESGKHAKVTNLCTSTFCSRSFKIQQHTTRLSKLQTQSFTHTHTKQSILSKHSQQHIHYAHPNHRLLLCTETPYWWQTAGIYRKYCQFGQKWTYKVQWLTFHDWHQCTEFSSRLALCAESLWHCWLGDSNGIQHAMSCSTYAQMFFFWGPSPMWINSGKGWRNEKNSGNLYDNEK